MGGYVGPAMYLQYQTMPARSVPSSGGSDMGWIPAAIGGAATLGGAAMGGKGAGQAAKSQERSNAAALQFAREQEQTRQQNFNRAYDIWNASRQALLDRYGISLPSVPQSYSAPYSGPVPAPTAARVAGGAVRPVAAAPAGVMPQTIGEMLQTKDPFSFPGGPGPAVA